MARVYWGFDGIGGRLKRGKPCFANIQNRNARNGFGSGIGLKRRFIGLFECQLDRERVGNLRVCRF